MSWSDPCPKCKNHRADCECFDSIKAQENQKEIMTIQKFLGKKIKYDREGQKIWAVDKKDGHQMIADIRGWGAIQNLFKKTGGEIDMEKAEAFQDELGQFIADAIQEKLNNNADKSALDLRAKLLLEIDNGVAEFYDEENPKSKNADLCTIGEFVATKLGYL